MTILRYPEPAADPGPSSTQDDYMFQVLQNQQYAFQLIGGDLPAGTRVTMTDGSGQAIPLSASFDGQLDFAILEAGTYEVSVGGWTSVESAEFAYQLLITFLGGQDNAPPLVDGPAPALQISLASTVALPGAPTPGGPTSSGEAGAGTGTLQIVGPIDTGSVGGPAVGGSAVGGGSGAAGSTVGSSPASVSGAVALDPAQNDAVAGLTGLGMGPLGGLGGQAGSLPSATIQVALNVPSTSAPASSSLVVSLVTLTQMTSWNRETDGSEPAETSNPQGDGASDPPIPHMTASIVAGIGPPSGPDGDTPDGDPSSPVTGTGPSPGLALPLDSIATAVPVVASAAEGASEPGVESSAAPPVEAGRDQTRGEAVNWVARWAIVAATVATVYRGRTVIRGLDWKKRACAIGRRFHRGAQPAGSTRW